VADTEALLADALKRIQRLEDEAEIRNLLSSYGLTTDGGDAEACAQIFAEDCHIDIDGAAFMDGREQARGIVSSPLHQEIMPNCAHLMGPFHIKWPRDGNGETAIATGYATVYLKEDGAVKIWRQSYGRWELVRRDGRWQVLKRTSRSTGRDDCQELLLQGL
jgi:uncharacterized protein (TIGR02246 family)